MAVFGNRKENQHLEEHLQRAFEAARNEGQDNIANQVHGLLCQLLQTKVDQCLRSLQPQEALAYAKEHVEIAPPHNGFSLLSKTYCILAYYREAEALARCGLLKVTLDHREAMQHFIHTARVHYAKRCDPVHHLPAEIMAGIMQYILQERITCLGVSHNWRHRLQLLPIWQTLEVVKWLPRQERNAHCMRTVLRPELRNIVWASNVSLCWFLSKLTQHQCNRIQKLDLTTDYCETLELNMREPIHMASESHPSYSSMEFFESIVHLGEHLTELTLRMMWRPHQLIRTILAALPQLVFLTCEDTHGRVINDERCPPIPLPASVQLQHLACDGAYWALEELDFIPSIAPRLRSFQIAMDLQNLFAYNPLFENFQQMCPNLQAFDCSGRCAYPITKKWFGRFYSQEHHDHSPSGLRFFAVYPQAFNRGSSGIPDWIFQNQGSLEVLSCGARSQPLVGVADVQSERFICCKRLTALDIRVGFPAQLGQLHRFLLSHSQLKTLALHGMQPTEESMATIARLPCLELLHFVGCSFLNPAPLLAFLQNYTSKIKVLEITEITSHESAFNEQVFAALGRMNSLKALSFCFFKTLFSNDCILIQDTYLHAFIQNAVESGMDQGLEYLNYTDDKVTFESSYMKTLVRATFANAIHGALTSVEKDIAEIVSCVAHM